MIVGLRLASLYLWRINVPFELFIFLVAGGGAIWAFLEWYFRQYPEEPGGSGNQQPVFDVFGRHGHKESAAKSHTHPGESGNLKRRSNG
jgi:hypothetical protein